MNETNSSKKNHASTQKSKNFLGVRLNTENAVLVFFVFLILILSLFPVNYGFWRDELYYIALSKHLAWGYVDVPPLLPFVIAIVRYLFGESFFTMHLIPAFCSAIVLILTREIVRKFGGKLFAQTIALLCLTMGGFIFYGSKLTYDCLDYLFWTVCLYYLVLLLTTNNKRYWLYLGIFVGLGLMSKFGMCWLIFGVVLAMLFTKERRYFVTWQFWVGGIIALVIISPYLIWIVKTNFLTFEYFANYTKSTIVLNWLTFFIDQIKTTNPLSLPIWVTGFYYFLINHEGKKFRLFALVYIFIAVVIIIQQAKFYTILPFFPVLFAGGAVLAEKLVKKFRSLYYLVFIDIGLVIIFGLIMLPVERPIFPIDFTIKYLNYIGLFKPNSEMSTEKYTVGILPQIHADSFGWQEMTKQVAKVYYTLPKKKRAQTAIVTRNYGEASCIYFYSAKYNLPMPISQHLQYYVWGYRNAKTSGTFIIIGYPNITDLQKTCKAVKQVGQTYNRYAVPYENNPIFLCRGLKKPIQQVWQEGKKMDM